MEQRGATVTWMRISLWRSTLVLAAVTALAWPWIANAADPFLIVPPAEEVESSPAYRYAHMTPKQAIDELDRRGILYQQVQPHGRVQTPVRLTGRLQGVHFHSSLPEHERPTTPFEICDARFALTLDDFARILKRHDIVEVVHFTMFRQWARGASTGSAAVPAKAVLPTSKASTRGKIVRSKTAASKKAKQKRTAAKTSSSKLSPIMTGPSRHSVGLAIDVGVMVKRDGTIHSVQSHFGGKVGIKTCGSGARKPTETRAKLLWDVVCDAFDEKIFTYVLTPNFDESHKDHLHMEINPSVKWFLYH